MMNETIRTIITSAGNRYAVTGFLITTYSTPNARCTRPPAIAGCRGSLPTNANKTVMPPSIMPRPTNLNAGTHYFIGADQATRPTANSCSTYCRLCSIANPTLLSVDERPEFFLSITCTVSNSSGEISGSCAPGILSPLCFTYPA